MIDDMLFKQAMGEFATGVTVVTTKTFDSQLPTGITVNAFMSLSMDPMLVAISIRNNGSIIRSLKEAPAFGISILNNAQKELSQIFAKQIEQSQPVRFDTLNGTDVIEDALVRMRCVTDEIVEAGDHTVFIAHVTDIEVNEGKPLLYYQGKYHELK